MDLLKGKKRYGSTKNEWKESDHPRAKDGKFGSGGGGDKKSAPKKKVEKQGQTPDGFTFHVLEEADGTFYAGWSDPDHSGPEEKNKKTKFKTEAEALAWAKGEIKKKGGII